MSNPKNYFIAVVVLIVVSGFTTVLRAQDQGVVDTPDVKVVKYSWSKERVGWERDPFSGPIENFDEMRVRTRNEKRIMDTKRGGSSVETGKAERDALTDQALTSAIHNAPPARYGFAYKVSFQNTGSKEITALDWDYVFYDLNSEEELGRREFGSERKDRSGENQRTKVLYLWTSDPED